MSGEECPNCKNYTLFFEMGCDIGKCIICKHVVSFESHKIATSTMRVK